MTRIDFSHHVIDDHAHWHKDRVQQIKTLFNAGNPVMEDLVLEVMFC